MLESINCAAKMKVAVSYALLRKPLKDTLGYIEWLRVDRNGMLDLLASGKPEDLVITKEKALEHTSLIEGNCKMSSFFDFRYNKASETSLEHIPNIVIRKTKPLGHYGRLRKAYLEMHRPILFNELALSDKLFEHCAEIDEAARSRMELIVRSLAEQNGVTEQLKAENQMEWVRQMNACKAQAEEVVKAELIYD